MPPTSTACAGSVVVSYSFSIAIFFQSKTRVLQIHSTSVAAVTWTNVLQSAMYTFVPPVALFYAHAQECDFM